MKTLTATLSLAALLGAALPAQAVLPGVFDPRNPNSLSTSGRAQTAKPYALTGSNRTTQREPNDARVQVNSQLGARAVITTHDDSRNR